MEQNIISQISPQLPTHKKRNIFRLFEFGMLEIGFVVFLLMLIFGTLNYFKIFSVSKIIPDLSFLSHSSTQLTSLQRTQGNIALEKLLISQLKPLYAPPVFILIAPKKQDDLYSYSWKNSSVQLSVLVANYTGNPSNLEVIKIQSPLLSNSLNASSSASQALFTFFLPQKQSPKWTCQTSGHSLACQYVHVTNVTFQSYKILLSVPRKLEFITTCTMTIGKSSINYCAGYE